MKTWSHPRHLVPAFALLLAATPQRSSSQEPAPAENPAPAAAAEDVASEDDALESLGKSAARFVAAFNSSPNDAPVLR